MPSVNGNDLVLAIRMRELCRPPTAWNRTLWSVSAQAALREVLEAARVRRDGILSDASVSDLQASTAILIGCDPGAGDAQARKVLHPFLSGKTVITPNSLAAAHIERAVNDLDVNYLPRWAAEVDRGLPDTLIEQCARSVMSHLLNRGHSADAIANRVRSAVLARGSNILSAGELIRDLHAFATTPEQTFIAVFPVTSAPLSRKTRSPGWMDGASVSEWMRNNGIAPSLMALALGAQ